MNCANMYLLTQFQILYISNRIKILIVLFRFVSYLLFFLVKYSIGASSLTVIFGNLVKDNKIPNWKLTMQQKFYLFHPLLGTAVNKFSLFFNILQKDQNNWINELEKYG
jgi:hypothetical protein